MLHYSGVNRGEPRDYCFVEFTSREVASTIITTAQLLVLQLGGRAG